MSSFLKYLNNFKFGSTFKNDAYVLLSAFRFQWQHFIAISVALACYLFKIVPVNHAMDDCFVSFKNSLPAF